jgi:hypothetical protein
MDAVSIDKGWIEVPVELRCDSRRCWKCSDDVCEERFDDLVFGVGP